MYLPLQVGISGCTILDTNKYCTNYRCLQPFSAFLALIKADLSRVNPKDKCNQLQPALQSIQA